jgi:Right handed beta helix region
MRLKSLMLALTMIGLAMPLLYTAPAQAQASRTWISGLGDDANPCSRTAPCKTWAGAITKTTNGGEIDALDPGGFGALNITKSITLDGGGGQVASTLVAGTNGFVVNAGATDVVIIRNIRIQGLLGNGGAPANAGINGIQFNSGAKLIVDNCDITGFNTDGILVNGAGFVAINNTRIENVGNAGIGVGAFPALVEIDNSRMYWNKFGLAVGNTAKVLMSNSVVSNGVTAGVFADTSAQVMLNNNVISFNQTGISGNTTSFNNNKLFGNIGNGTAPNNGGTTTNPTNME